MSLELNWWISTGIGNNPPMIVNLNKIANIIFSPDDITVSFSSGDELSLSKDEALNLLHFLHTNLPIGSPLRKGLIDISVRLSARGEL